MASDDIVFDSFEFKRGEYINDDVTICKMHAKTKKIKGNLISCISFTTSNGNKFTSGLMGTNKIYLQSKGTFLAGFYGT